MLRNSPQERRNNLPDADRKTIVSRLLGDIRQRFPEVRTTTADELPRLDDVPSADDLSKK